MFIPMLATLVMTVNGPDRPGLVELLAARVADHGGNWLESRMCRLGGQFTGILRVEVPAERQDELIQALQTLEAEGLQVILQPEGGVEVLTNPNAVLATVELVGHDRPGILRDVSGVFARNGVNVEELSSECVSAPMGGGTLFKARFAVAVPPSTRLARVQTDLEAIATDLMVDLKIAEARNPDSRRPAADGAAGR